MDIVGKALLPNGLERKQRIMAVVIDQDQILLGEFRTDQSPVGDVVASRDMAAVVGATRPDVHEQRA